MSKFKVGDNAWVLDTGTGWVKVKIIRVSGNYYRVRRLDAPTAFGVPGHRLYTDEEYQKLNIQKPTFLRPPPLH